MNFNYTINLEEVNYETDNRVVINYDSPGELLDIEKVTIQTGLNTQQDIFDIRQSIMGMALTDGYMKNSNDQEVIGMQLTDSNWINTGQNYQNLSAIKRQIINSFDGVVMVNLSLLLIAYAMIMDININPILTNNGLIGGQQVVDINKLKIVIQHILNNVPGLEELRIRIGTGVIINGRNWLDNLLNMDNNQWYSFDSRVVCPDEQFRSNGEIKIMQYVINCTGTKIYTPKINPFNHHISLLPLISPPLDDDDYMETDNDTVHALNNPLNDDTDPQHQLVDADQKKLMIILYRIHDDMNYHLPYLCLTVF